VWAGPAEVAKSARIVDKDGHGAVVLREENNGFTCMPGNPRIIEFWSEHLRQHDR
jgi:hypothetical protein